MTTLISLVLAIYFGATPTQVQYCQEDQWSQEIIVINNRPTLTYDARAKAKACEFIIKQYTNNEY